jgi:hypothetical protein
VLFWKARQQLDLEILNGNCVSVDSTLIGAAPFVEGRVNAVSLLQDYQQKQDFAKYGR